MPQAIWIATPKGEYWIDVRLGQHSVEVLIDTGLIDAKGQIGFSIEPTLYDLIKKSSGFLKHQTHARMMADGKIHVTESGLLDAQLVLPQSSTAIGPIVSCYVYRGYVGVPNRVGVAFFHQLTSCQVLWELDQRQWQIHYP